MDIADGVLLGALQADLVSEQVSDVVDVVVDHSRSFQTETPSNNTDIRVEAHRLEHFWAENATVSNLNPFLKSRMISEDFKTRLSVWVVSRLELHLFNTNLSEESLHNTKQMAQTNTLINDNTFNLMEFSQVSGIKSLVSENTINREELVRLEVFFAELSKLVEHLGTDSSGVSSQNILHGFVNTPGVLVSE